MNEKKTCEFICQSNYEYDRKYVGLRDVIYASKKIATTTSENFNFHGKNSFYMVQAIYRST